MIEVFLVFAFVWTRHCHLSEGESSRDEWCERLAGHQTRQLASLNTKLLDWNIFDSRKRKNDIEDERDTVEECVYCTKRGKTEALPKYVGVYTSGVEPWRVTSIEPLTLSMGSDQPTDIRATSVQRMPYSPVHSRVIAFPLEFTKKIRITKTYKAERAKVSSKLVPNAEIHKKIRTTKT